MVRGLLTAVVGAVTLTLLIGGGIHSYRDAQADVGVNIDALPEAARDTLHEVDDALRSTCPELPLLWVVAQIHADSGWDPRTFSAGRHLTDSLPRMCADLRAVTAHLQQTGKPVEALDALAVCHKVGCSRVYESASGIPAAGEAGCNTTCASQVTAYLRAIHSSVRAFAAQPDDVTAAGAAPEPYLGDAGECRLPDPTGTGGCVTGATAWLLTQVATHIHQGRATCWDAHEWNPSSDHPRGRACDYTFGRLGTFPGPGDRAAGWALAEWLRAYADHLRVAYIIWQGQIWSARRDDEGWRPYKGGGVYDPSDPTGGHFDHVHVSLTS